jgi:threonine/homoserine/homoserine lactone efflux protein
MLISWTSYGLFIVAGLALILVPGPDMLFMLGRSIAQGRRAGVVAAFGINAGGYVHLTAAITGLSAILLTSALAFTIVKWAGAAYLVYLGISALHDRAGALSLSGGEVPAKRLRAIFVQGFLSDVLNPKVAVFFLALLPQFVDLKAGHPVAQLLVLGLTVNMLAIIVNLILVMLSARISRKLRGNPRTARRLQSAMGVLFIGLGARLATERL